MTDNVVKPSVTVLGPGDPGWRPRDVSPRTEADAQIARALQIVVDADHDDEGDNNKNRRDYTPDELETLFFSLGMALVQLRKLPGGKEARDRFYRRAEAELEVRGRHDILEKLEADAELRRVDRALDDLGVPREAQANEPVSAGQPLGVESRVRWLGHELRRAELRGKSPDVERLRHLARSAEEIEDEAAKIVRRTFGDDADLSAGTTGHAYVEAVKIELEKLETLRGELLAVASTIRQP